MNSSSGRAPPAICSFLSLDKPRHSTNTPDHPQGLYPRQFEVSAGHCPRPWRRRSVRGSEMARRPEVVTHPDPVKGDGRGAKWRGSLDADIIIANAPDPVFVSDLEGKILQANDAVSQLLGFRQDEVLEQSLSRFISAEETREFMAALREVVERGVTRNARLNPRSASGQVIPTTLNASALRDPDGKVIGAIGILRDMRELDKARAYAESLIKNAPDPVFVSDLEGKILQANEAVSQLLGFRPDELLEQSLSRFISPESAGELTAPLRAVVVRGVIRHEALNPRSASGEVNQTALHASAVRDVGGRLIGATLTLRAIRERDTPPLHAALPISNAPDPVFVSDLEGKILQANDAVSQLLGFRPAELLEQSLSRFISPAETREFTAALREVVERGVMRNVVLNPRSASGEVIPTSLNASALRDADGRAIGVIGILRDMRELDKARAYAESLIKNAPDAVFVSDLEGKILQANDAVFALLGFRPDELIEQSLSRIISPDETREFLAALREVVERGVTRNARLNPRSASGEVIPTSLNASALRDADGKVIGAIGILRDMRELDKARAYAESLIKNAPDPVFVSDLEGKILQANDAVSQLLGFRQDEVLEQSLSRFISPEETREFTAALREVVERGKRRKEGLNPRSASDEVIPTSLNASALRDPDGRAIGGIGILRDMRELDKARAYAESLIKNAPDPVFVSDLEGKILQANDAVSALLGFRPDELLEQSLSRFISPEETREFTAALREVVAKGVTRNARLNPRSASGEVIPTTLNASALRDPDGRVIGAIGILRDMRELDKARAYAESLIKNAPDPVFVSDLEGKILQANDAVSQLLGFRPDELIEQSLSKFISPEETREFTAALREVVAKGVTRNARLNPRSASGEGIPTTLNASALRDAAGTVIGVIGILRDMRELDKAREAAEIANRAKSQFLANMSHELRTPLNAIILYTELLRDEATDRHLDDFLPDLKKIHGAANHLLALINDVLDLSKIESGKLELVLETFDVAAMIRDVVTTIEPLAQKNADRLEVRCPNDVGTMHADLTKVRQSLFNLLSNACKFTEGGTVRLEVARAADGNWFTFR